MAVNKRQTVIILTLFTLAAVSFLFIVNESFNTQSKINDLELNFKKVMLGHEISEDILRVITAVQDYIFYSDQQYIEDFRRHSSITIKHELELYNLVSPSKKQDVEDLVEFSKAYHWFVEKEVIPLMKSGRLSEYDVRYIQMRNKEYARNLTGKADAVVTAERKETEYHFKREIIGKNTKVVVLLAVFLAALWLLIMELFKALKPLLARCAYLDRLSDRTNNAVIGADRKGNIVVFNKSAGDLLGVSPDLILRRNLSEIPVLFPNLQNVVQPLQEVILQRADLNGQRMKYSLFGKKIDLAADYVPVDFFGRAEGAVMIAHRVEELKDKHVLLETLEAERKRISIEIHDWIGRHMSTMIHSLDYILRLGRDSAPGEWRDNLLALRAHCQNAAIEMRGIMNDIHPYLIDRVGLISALESYIATFEKLNKIKVYIYYQDRSIKVRKKDEIIIYRIIQEALTNVTKHGKATEVDVEFTVSHDTLKIEVTDNGGAAGDFTAGKGIWGMKERANLIGGDITFDSTGSGFCVTLTVPVLTEG